MKTAAFLLLCLGATAAFAPISTPSRGRDASTLLQMKPNHQDALAKCMTAGMIAASAMLGPINLDQDHRPVVPVASAVESRVIGELKGSGLVFKVCQILERVLASLLIPCSPNRLL